MRGDSNHHLLGVGRQEQNRVAFHPSENIFAYLLSDNAKLAGVTQSLQFTTAGGKLTSAVNPTNPGSD